MSYAQNGNDLTHWTRGGGDFRVKFQYGKHAEWYSKMVWEHILESSPEIEVKRESRENGDFYIETEQDPGRTGTFKPSGITQTATSYWIEALGNTGIIVGIPTWILRRAVESKYGKELNFTEGDNPTKGRLMSLKNIVESMDADKKASRCIHQEAPAKFLDQDFFKVFPPGDHRDPASICYQKCLKDCCRTASSQNLKTDEQENGKQGELPFSRF